MDGWEIFRENNGEGNFNLNRILYNDDDDYAIFEVNYGCGWLCGHGFIVDADKIDGVWEVCVRETWIA